MSTLKIDAITLTFGGLAALSKVNMEIKPGLITSIIGPNGAGKTSLLNCISGFYKPQLGDIFFEDKKITRIRPDRAGKCRIGTSTGPATTPGPGRASRTTARSRSHRPAPCPRGPFTAAGLTRTSRR